MALSAARNTPVLGAGGIPKQFSLPVKGSTTIYEGSLVAVDANGLAVPGSVSTTLTAVGRAAATVVNSGADSALYVPVESGTFVWGVHGSAITEADLFDTVYIYDDETVTKTGTGASVAGTIFQVDSIGAWILVQPPLPSLPIDLATFESDLASTTNGEGASLVGIEDSAGYYTGGTVELALAEAMAHTRSVISCPIPAYSAIADAGVLLRLTPGYAGRILGMHVQATTAVTTGTKASTLTPKIAGGAVTGGVVSMTSAGQNAIGAVQNGTAVTAANTFTAAQEITVVASSTTAFVEGAGVIYLVLG